VSEMADLSGAEVAELSRLALKSVTRLRENIGDILQYLNACAMAESDERFKFSKLEAMVGEIGPVMALIFLALTPIIFSIPSMLMVREMSSMMPAEGGFYHWVKQAFGPFAGFIVAWMNLLTSWLDVSIYPVLAMMYLGYYFPVFRDGITIGGLEISGDILQWIFALILIWLIVLLQIRGARLTGITTDWMTVVMLVPLIIMSIFGIVNWIRSGVTISLPLLPEGQTVVGAFSVGLFVAMWNFMGWELPSSAGDEIVKPRRTYPIAMTLTLVVTIATYAIPMAAGLYGGAGEGGRYQLWGIEENEAGEGVGPALEEYGVTEEQMTELGVDPTNATAWNYPEIAHAIGAVFSGSNGNFALLLGGLVTFSAILSMIGLFIGNSLGAGRLPYALAEDGMMPLWLVKTHPKYGTPWVAILIAGIMFSIFSLGSFAFLVVIDVFMDTMALLLEFLALWKLRFSKPDIPRDKIPGGWVGLTLATLGPALIIFAAVISQIIYEGWNSMFLAAIMILVGAALYLPLRKWVKPGIPDVDPFRLEAAVDED